MGPNIGSLSAKDVLMTCAMMLARYPANGGEISRRSGSLAAAKRHMALERDEWLHLRIGTWLSDSAQFYYSIFFRDVE